MRDPRDGTWLAIVDLNGERLSISRLNPTGRHGLQAYLRDPDQALMNVEAIGLDFPFALPEPFAQSLLGGEFPSEGWWALVKRVERISRPDFLVAVQEFRESSGEVKRCTDESAGAESPLHREPRDRSARAYHGMRMIAEDRSRYAIRPFENAQGKLLLEVYPDAMLAGRKPGEVLDQLRQLPELPVDITTAQRRTCETQRGALNAVLSARYAALAVLSGEADRTPEELAPEHAERVRREGWIYGLSASHPV